MKRITTRHEVYKKLLAVKGKDEGFSELLERLVEGVNPLEGLTKIRGGVELNNKEKMLSKINALRTECML